jgi:phosphoribosylamine--glycine ligase
MAVSGGYPEDYKRDMEIKGLPEMQPADEDVLVFHAGTKMIDEQVVTNGGRVLAVTAFGQTIGDAVKKSQTALKDISFKGMYYRKDIGFEFQKD